MHFMFPWTTKTFLSTPSARRATEIFPTRPVFSVYFDPRPPRGGRPQCGGGGARKSLISIHALREEGDFEVGKTDIILYKFLSTPSARRAT